MDTTMDHNKAISCADLIQADLSSPDLAATQHYTTQLWEAHKIHISPKLAKYRDRQKDLEGNINSSPHDVHFLRMSQLENHQGSSPC